GDISSTANRVALHNSAAISRIELGTVCRADEQMGVPIIVDRYPFMSTGFLVGRKVAVGKVHQQTAMTICRVGEALSSIDCLVCVTNNGPRMCWWGRCWRRHRCWCWLGGGCRW